MNERLRKHYETLAEVFPQHRAWSVGDLRKQLQVLERRGNALATKISTRYVPSERVEAAAQKILRDADALLRFTEAGVPVRLNRDPRGAALKIDAEHVPSFLRERSLYTDFSGDVMLSPRERRR